MPEYEGTLYIDPDNGVVKFETRTGVRLLRVTHLLEPIPTDSAIDLVAISNVTSYTPLTQAEVDDWLDPAEEAKRGGSNAK